MRSYAFFILVGFTALAINAPARQAQTVPKHSVPHKVHRRQKAAVKDSVSATVKKRNELLQRTLKEKNFHIPPGNPAPKK